jgi:tetratricopeptide (TPR) repeat protein
MAIGRGDYEASARMAQERYDALGDREDASRVRLELARTLTQIKLRTQHGFGEHAADHVRLAEQYGDEAGIADAYVGFALHHMVTGMRGLGRVVFTAAAELARRNHQLDTLSRALVNLNVSWAYDDAARARDYGLEAVEVARQAGAVIALSSAESNLALARLVTGDWDDALASADEAELDEPLAELVRARIAGARGTRWHLPPHLGDPGYAGGDLSLRCFAEILRALDAQGAGRPAGAVARQAAETAYSVAGLYDDFTLIWLVATEVAWADGDRDALDGLLALVDDHRGGALPVGVRAQRSRIAGLRAAAGGDDGAAEAHLREAITTALQWHAEPTAALCRADLAAVLQRQGRADEAVEQAALAQEVFARLGATRWAADQVSA